MDLLVISTVPESAEEAYADWSILDDPEVQSVARAVARQFGRDYGLTLEREDAYQEACIILAERARTARATLTQGSGLLHRWLGQRLRDVVLTTAKHRQKLTSYEANMQSFDARSV